MIQRIKRNVLPTIIALSAFSVSASAAFYSVSGLSKLFAGASFEVIIMAGSLEVSKLVIASLLYQYWDTINKYLRTYLTIAATILVIITSMGIYGFLSAAYQETYQKLKVQENQISFLESKAKFYEDDVARYDEELKRISNNISTLSGAKATSIQVRDTSAVGGVRSTISTAELRLAQSRIQVEEDNRKAVNVQRTVAADSLQKFQLEILELENNADTVGELGPLQYLSGLTGTPMDKIINILLLIIIFVFDPLAISLVIAANFAFDQANRKNLYDEYEDEIEPDLWDDDPWEEDEEGFPLPNKDLTEAAKEFEVVAEEVLPDEARGFAPPTSEDPLLDYDEDDEKRMNIVGQNGNEGIHYDEANSPEIDWKVVDEEISDPTPVKIVQKGPSQHRVLYSNGDIKKVNKDDDIIRYL
jgi:hypothetical protein